MSTIALDVVIDGSRAAQGAAQVEQSLGRVKTAADATVTSTQNVGRAMSSAFQATGGTIQVAQGITQTAKAFGDLNVSAGLFSSSRALLEIGRTVQDFRSMRSAIGGASGAIGLFSAAFRASPIGVVATVVGLAATAMSLFGSKTDEATEAVGRQASALGEMLAKSREFSIRSGYGERDPRATTSGTVDVLTQLRLSDKRQFQAGEAASLFGVPEEQLRYAIGEKGRELARPGDFGYGARQFGTGPAFRYGTFDRDEVIYAGEQLLSRRRIEEAARPSAGGTDAFLGPVGPGSKNPFTERLGIFGPGEPHKYVLQSEGDRVHLDYENTKRDYERQEKAAERVATIFEGIGQSIGAVAADLLFAGGSFRQAIAGLVRQGATSGLQAAFGAAFGAIGKTAAQGRSDGGGNLSLPPAEG